jgi:hypothetical protein
MKVTIHQAEHLVWLGLLHKISQADIFVLADTFDFKKNYFENRNKIRTNEGSKFITVPVESHNHKPMKDIKIALNIEWEERYINTIAAHYLKAPYFYTYFNDLCNIIDNPGRYLVPLNHRLLIYFCKCFSINTPIILSSELKLDESLRSSERLLEICHKVHASEYLSGPSGKDYLDLDLFKKNNIKIEFHEFIHPTYKQVYDPFIPNLSALDYLFNCGGCL